MSTQKRKRPVAESGDEEEHPSSRRNRRQLQDHGDDFETMETEGNEGWTTDPGAIEYVRVSTKQVT